MGKPGRPRTYPDSFRERAVTRMQPTRLSDIDVALQSVAWGTIPSTYVVCTEDRAIPPEYEEQWATERATAKIEVPFDHAPGLSHPTELANILADIIAEAATTWIAR
jgi:pimeloyl-ACP methyl ester carboxylesterase